MLPGRVRGDRLLETRDFFVVPSELLNDWRSAGGRVREGRPGLRPGITLEWRAGRLNVPAKRPGALEEGKLKFRDAASLRLQALSRGVGARGCAPCVVDRHGCARGRCRP